MSCWWREISSNVEMIHSLCSARLRIKLSVTAAQKEWLQEICQGATLMVDLLSRTSRTSIQTSRFYQLFVWWTSSFYGLYLLFSIIYSFPADRQVIESSGQVKISCYFWMDKFSKSLMSCPARGPGPVGRAKADTVSNQAAPSATDRQLIDWVEFNIQSASQRFCPLTHASVVSGAGWPRTGATRDDLA